MGRMPHNARVMGVAECDGFRIKNIFGCLYKPA